MYFCLHCLRHPAICEIIVYYLCISAYIVYVILLFVKLFCIIFALLPTLSRSSMLSIKEDLDTFTSRYGIQMHSESQQEREKVEQVRCILNI